MAALETAGGERIRCYAMRALLPSCCVSDLACVFLTLLHVALQQQSCQRQCERSQCFGKCSALHVRMVGTTTTARSGWRLTLGQICVDASGNAEILGE